MRYSACASALSRKCFTGGRYTLALHRGFSKSCLEVARVPCVTAREVLTIPSVREDFPCSVAVRFCRSCVRRVPRRSPSVRVYQLPTVVCGLVARGRWDGGY